MIAAKITTSINKTSKKCDCVDKSIRFFEAISCWFSDDANRTARPPYRFKNPALSALPLVWLIRLVARSCHLAQAAAPGCGQFVH